MSSKSMVWLVVVVLVLGGVWYFFGRSSMPAQQAVTPTGTQQTATTQQGGATQTQPVTQNDNQIQADSSLDADMSAIDSQATAAGDASASANSADTPVTQSE